MYLRSTTRFAPRVARSLISTRTRLRSQRIPVETKTSSSGFAIPRSHFHTSSALRASGISADEIMENLNDLYATAKDEFEIAAEGTEEKTVYAEEDREAAKEALTLLREAFDKAVAESNPEVAAEVQKRVGHRIRELANAVTAMEERAMED